MDVTWMEIPRQAPRCITHGGRRIRVMKAPSFGNPGDRAFCFPSRHMPRGASNVAFRSLVVRHLTISAAVRPGPTSPRPAAADAADVDGAGGPQAAVHDRREQPHRHARRWPDRSAPGDCPGEYERRERDDHL